MNHNIFKITMLITFALGVLPNLSAVDVETLFKDSKQSEAFKTDTQKLIDEAKAKADEIRKDATKTADKIAEDAKFFDDKATSLKTNLDAYTTTEKKYNQTPSPSQQVKELAIADGEKAVTEIDKIKTEILKEEETLTLTEQTTSGSTGTTPIPEQNLSPVEKLFSFVLKPFKALINRIDNIYKTLFNAPANSDLKTVLTQEAVKTEQSKNAIKKQIAPYIAIPSNQDLVLKLQEQADNLAKQENTYKLLIQDKPLETLNIPQSIAIEGTDVISEEARAEAKREVLRTPVDIATRDLFEKEYDRPYAFDVFPGVDEKTDFTQEIIQNIENTKISYVNTLNKVIEKTKKLNEDPGISNENKLINEKIITDFQKQIKDYTDAYDILRYTSRRFNEKSKLVQLKPNAQKIVDPRQANIDFIDKETRPVLDDAAQKVNETITAQKRATDINTEFEAVCFDSGTNAPIHNPYDVLGLSNNASDDDIFTAYKNKIPDIDKYNKVRALVIDAETKIKNAKNSPEKTSIRESLNKNLLAIDQQLPEIQLAFDMLTNNTPNNIKIKSINAIGNKVSMPATKQKIDVAISRITTEVNTKYL